MNISSLPLREYVELLRCPNCEVDSKLIINKDNDSITCSHCYKVYPIVENTVPLLLTQPNSQSKRLWQTRKIHDIQKLKEFSSLKELKLPTANQIRLGYYIAYCFSQLRKYPDLGREEIKETFFDYYYPRCHWIFQPGHLILKLFEGYCYQGTKIHTPSLEIGAAGAETSSINFQNQRLTFGLEYFGDFINNATLDQYQAVVNGGINPIPFKNQTFATIVAVHVVDHIVSSIDDFFSEISRVLKKDGRFIFTTHGNKYPFLQYYPLRPKSKEAARLWESQMLNATRCGRGNLRLFISDDPDDGLGQNNYSKDEWKDIAKKQGLKLIKYKEYICGPNARLFTLLWYFQLMKQPIVSGKFGQFFVKRLIKHMFLADENFSEQGGLEIYIEMEKSDL